MTLKDEIKNIIELDCVSQIYLINDVDRAKKDIDDLAQKIADALVVDEEKVAEITEAAVKILHIQYHRFPVPQEFAKAIAEAKPIGVKG